MISEENIERTHDENEREAMYAIMYAVASRGKGKRGKLPTLEELYKRPEDEDVTSKKAEDLIEETRKATEWLSQFDIAPKGKEENK